MAGVSEQHNVNTGPRASVYGASRRRSYKQCNAMPELLVVCQTHYRAGVLAVPGQIHRSSRPGWVLGQDSCVNSEIGEVGDS